MSISTPYPGVYVTEVPSGNRTVTGVATSITAFVGTARRGPLDTPVRIGSFTDFERAFGGLVRSSGLGYAVRDFYLNGGGPAYVVRVARQGDADPTHDAAAAQLVVGDVTLEAHGPGEWANDLVGVVTHPATADAADIGAAQGVDPDDLFTLTLSLGEETEVYRNVTVGDGPARLANLLESSRLVRQASASSTSAPGEDTYTVATGDEGTDGAAVEPDDYTDDGRGFHALDTVDLVNIVVLPPPTPSGSLHDSVWPLAAQYAASRRAFLVVDPKPGQTVEGFAAWADGLGVTGEVARNAAVYFPRVRHADPLRGGQVDTFAPGGAVAGVYARTDAARGVWKAPAGLEAGLTGVVALESTLTNDQNGQLNPAGYNALRTFRDAGSVVWGARTLRGADVLSDDYKYVPVRRLALFLEESLYRGTQWVVFEPNDEPLWSQIRLGVGAFMQDLFRRGAFQGTSARDAFFVRCDGETTSQYDIDRGVVNIQVGFAPLKPAEFVIVSIQQKTAAAR
ncbi:phage tail sheath subtilisin-like domain-containing protein [Isoptericola sp. b515]|uniref:phage tail sheath family protein n=1 Tax=Isoptericola sp. b515 TaxID=3064652 RepID=UPI002713AC1D|nr:phage tail sheath subtilisin-like domain-containing protein [Isoptericola sp. b515]MDO8149695.1 phage tail sheath subtilisin-like domain-containing protein [Isoptericola sp. b515]